MKRGQGPGVGCRGLRKALCALDYMLTQEAEQLHTPHSKLHTVSSGRWTAADKLPAGHRILHTAQLFAIISLRNATALAISPAGSSPHSLSIVRKPL